MADLKLTWAKDNREKLSLEWWGRCVYVGKGGSKLGTEWAGSQFDSAMFQSEVNSAVGSAQHWHSLPSLHTPHQTRTWVKANGEKWWLHQWGRVMRRASACPAQRGKTTTLLWHHGVEGLGFEGRLTHQRWKHVCPVAGEHQYTQAAALLDAQPPRSKFVGAPPGPSQPEEHPVQPPASLPPLPPVHAPLLQNRQKGDSARIVVACKEVLVKLLVDTAPVLQPGERGAKLICLDGLQVEREDASCAEAVLYGVRLEDKGQMSLVMNESEDLISAVVVVLLVSARDGDVLGLNGLSCMRWESKEDDLVINGQLSSIDGEMRCIAIEGRHHGADCGWQEARFKPPEIGKGEVAVLFPDSVNPPWRRLSGLPISTGSRDYGDVGLIITLPGANVSLADGLNDFCGAIAIRLDAFFLKMWLVVKLSSANTQGFSCCALALSSNCLVLSIDRGWPLDDWAIQDCPGTPSHPMGWQWITELCKGIDEFIVGHPKAEERFGFGGGGERKLALNVRQKDGLGTRKNKKEEEANCPGTAARSRSYLDQEVQLSRCKARPKARQRRTCRGDQLILWHIPLLRHPRKVARALAKPQADMVSAHHGKRLNHQSRSAASPVHSSHGDISGPRLLGLSRLIVFVLPGFGRLQLSSSPPISPAIGFVQEAAGLLRKSSSTSYGELVSGPLPPSPWAI
ncbi:hypothetical protein BDK51DRAFT_30309 [Blyttiomyces helicus]|uniref:Uncharacterized protein n=1 Tax=Blyttiomyces helicus TaxID=388810 RepID=A0A4P9WMF5_9FUNG|nr:hypothetical protein BDK51DRAFT_30309 [Blyttiomyces helicus]|eukprot:RKO93395.1 hypothetical protein BDK51DRAFT_30309 [Blyttiomyces helicus]